jgi:hypothetical protein
MADAFAALIGLALEMKRGFCVPVFLAGILQLLPLAGVAWQRFAAASFPGTAFVWRTGTIAAALSGFDAVSGASYIIPNGHSYNLKVGVATNLILAYSGSYVPKGWSANPNPVCPGMTLVNNGATAAIAGTPVVAGTFSATAICWENANLSGNAQSANFTFSVASAGPPPVVSNILVSPGTSVSVQSSVSMTPVIGGTGPFTYRWFQDGNPIFGGTNAVLVLASVQSASSGAYTLAVRNISGFGFASTNLIVNGPVVVTRQPQNQFVPPGGNAAFSVLAGGGGLSYQWRMHGTNLPGRNASTLALTNVDVSSVGTYSVQVSNALGAVFSSNSYLRLATSSITSTTLLFGLSKSWRFNTNAVELGASWREFDYNDASWPAGPGILAKEDPGNPVVFPNIGTLFPTTGVVPRYITNYYFRTHFPVTNLSRLTGLSVSNIFDDAGIVHLNGVEVLRGTNLPTGPVTANTWALAPAQEGVFTTAGIPPSAAVQGDNVLAVEVHQAGTNTSSDVVMGLALFATVEDPQTFPAFLQQPSGLSVNAGTSASMSVAADGADPLGFAWFRNGNVVPGQTNATLLLPAVQSADAGAYRCVVANPFNAATSQVAILTVVETLPPVITAQPADQIVPSASNAQFAIVADRAGGYLWWFNGAAIPGAGGPVLELAAVAETNSGFYSAVVTNHAGSVTSRDARLLVVPPPNPALAPRLGAFSSGLSFHTSPGYRYLLQSTPALGGAEWNTVTNLPPLFEPALYQFAPVPSGSTQEFFRVLMTR